jgi:spermidine synthase
MINLLFIYYGFLALLAQLVLFRELSVLFYGSELFLGTFLSSWLFWVGLGSLSAKRFLKRGQSAVDGSTSLSVDYFSYGFLALSLLLPLTILFIRLSRGVFHFGEFIGPAEIILFTFSVMSFSCFLIGVQFSLACAIVTDKGKEGSALGRVYLCEAFGSVLAGVLFTYFLIGRVPTFTIVLLLSSGCILASLILFKRMMDPKKAGLFALAGFLLFAALAIEPGVNRVQWKKYELIKQKETRHATLTLTKTGSIKNVFVDGLISASFPDPENYEPIAHWPLLATAKARRILVLGDFSLGILKEALKHSPQSVDYCVLDNAFLKLVRPYLDPEDLSALDDSRIHVYYGDPRLFVKMNKGLYDAVIVNIPEVPNLKLNRFYTQEFYSQLKAILEPGGVLALSAASSENYLSGPTRVFDASVYQTLKSVFGTIEVIPGDNITFLVSPSTIDLKRETILDRFKQRGIVNHNFVPSYIQYRLIAGRRAELKRLLEETPGVETNKDFRPTAYYYFTNFWLNKLGSSFGTLMAGIFLAVFFYVIYRKRKKFTFSGEKKECVLIFFIGFMGIVLELMLLLGFQIISGYVYWQMGMLFASFMLGLFLGSGAAVRLKEKPQKMNSILLVMLSLAMIGLSFGAGYFLPRMASLSAFENIIFFLSLLVCVGALTGEAFVIAGFLLKTQDVMEKAGSLYAADLWGSALGAILLTNLIIPFFGLLGALNFSAIIGLAGLTIYLVLSKDVGKP